MAFQQLQNFIIHKTEKIKKVLVSKAEKAVDWKTAGFTVINVLIALKPKPRSDVTLLYYNLQTVTEDQLL